MDVHLRQLRYFVAVAEQLHFGRAAEDLFVSQPALSKQVRALEAQLRTTLFNRDRRQVRLTAAGAALLPAARSVLATWQAAESAVADADAAGEATLVIGISTGVGRGLLPAVRTRFASLVPSARLQVRQVSWHDATGGLAADGTDAALVWLPLPDPERFSWMTVAVEQQFVAMAAHHPLATRSALDLADLRDEPFIALPRDSRPLRDFWLATHSRPLGAVRIGAEVATTEEALEALTAGLGVCLIAAGNVPLITQHGIVARPITGLPPSELVLAWRSGDERRLLRHLKTSVDLAVKNETHDEAQPTAE